MVGKNYFDLFFLFVITISCTTGILFLIQPEWSNNFLLIGGLTILIYMVTLFISFTATELEKPIKILLLVSIQILFFLGVVFYLFFSMEDINKILLFFIEYICLLIVQTIYLAKNY